MAFNVNEGGDDAPMNDINVTPLVDVMLVLLIVFMITMPVLTHSIQINLPTTSSTKEQPKQDVKPINLAVTAAGKYTLGEESTNEMDLPAVKAKLEELAKNDPDAVLAIDADKDTPYENVAKVLEVAKDAGIVKVSFRLENKNQ
ncbi:biopolymer transporter ExbD [Kingella sp. (in: b-proteobacteria)]|uniref:ExbD/TolR family protein n=1 Tax=Kingella sp. (in: b-proteobacteria) TaxID=2020713 RepID=UPI0026DBADFF|nr:biopolymer transporter ExbD [Kingella sp. (in: b-proteobacteria)]MDO4656573.1 biopolymer transporter ExbD [Kingella sp. (in: b-proteobacteria)]